MVYKEANKNESITSIEFLIGGDHRKGLFIASININAKFIPVRNITTIFRIVHFQCKKDNGEIMGNAVMAPIGYRLKNICACSFLGWTHEGKIQFIILPHVCTIPSPREKTICSSVRPRVFVTGDLAFYAIVIGKEGRSPH